MASETEKEETPKTGEHNMASETEKEETPKTKEIIFTCKFCEKPKPLGEMVVLTSFFPPVVACRDCGKKMR